MIGLGKLGIPIAACFAYKGYKVIGVDTDLTKIKAINQKICPIYEPEVQDLLEKIEDRFIATHDYDLAINNSNISFVLVPTPSDEYGGFSLEYVIPVCKRIGKILAEKSDFHLVVLTSTVMPGATGGLEIKDTLETYSNKICGKDFGLCYSPEFVALGDIVKNFLRPDFLLIGESDKFSGDILSSLYKNVCENDPPIARMNWINAELTKLALNSYITMKISFANTLAEICESLSRANVDRVTSAIGCDSRIGKKYLKGALGFSGPCFPRDSRAFDSMADIVGVDALLAQATDKINDRQVERVIRMVRNRLPLNGATAVLGITFKPGTDVVTESQGLEIAQRLGDEGIKVCIYDPLQDHFKNLPEILKTNMTMAFSIDGCVRNADIILIVNPCEEFRNIESKWLKDKVVIDCWRILKPEQYKNCKKYIAIGVNCEES